MSKIFSNAIELCRSFSNDKEIPRYPSWVTEPLETPSSNTESDSEYQNLFRLIQQNEFSLTQESSSDKTPANNETKDKFGRPLNGHPRQQTRTDIVRPTLFMKGMGNAKKTTKVHRKSSNFTGGTGDRMASIHLMMLQSSLAENVEPSFRKKDRIYLKVTPPFFNKYHKTAVKKINDRIRQYYNKDSGIINDRDNGEKIELEIETRHENITYNKCKGLELPQRLWGNDTPEISSKHRDQLTESVILKQELNYDMPHRNFSADVNRYVNRLKELAESINRDSLSHIVRADSVELDSAVLQSEVTEDRTKDFRFLPTINKYFHDKNSIPVSTNDDTIMEWLDEDKIRHQKSGSEKKSRKSNFSDLFSTARQIWSKKCLSSKSE